MSVRAKFRCHSVTSIDPGSTALARFINESQVPSHQSDIRLDAVWGDGTDNAAWSKATPNGHISISITVPEAAAVFTPGGEYWVDFTSVDDGPGGRSQLRRDGKDVVVGGTSGNAASVAN